jgi:hypothetical protein
MNMRKAGSSSVISFILNSLRVDTIGSAGPVTFTKILSIPYSRGIGLVRLEDVPSFYPALPSSRDIKGEAATAAAISIGS